MIDHTDTFKTMGFCPTCERYTAHVCAKCQPATPATTPDPQAEIAALRAERDALKAFAQRVSKIDIDTLGPIDALTELYKLRRTAQAFGA